MSLDEAIREGFGRFRVKLSLVQEAQFATYLEHLERWNRAVSLTSIRDRNTAILRHFVEPGMARSMLAGAGPRILDVGSGAGVPGLPLKILEPERALVMVEANGRKAAFLREVVDALELEETEVLEGRIEELIGREEIPSPVHVLTARAWSEYGPLLGLAASVMAPGGRAILFVGASTLRGLRRELARSPAAVQEAPEAWRSALAAGWRIRRVQDLPHLDRAAAVSVELPTP